MSGIRLFQPGGVGTLNDAGAQHPLPFEIDAGVICQLSFTGSTQLYRWILSKPSNSAAVLSSSGSAGPAFMPDIDGGSYSITLFDSDEAEYILDIVTPTTGGGGGGGGSAVSIAFANYAAVRAVTFSGGAPPSTFVVLGRTDAGDGGEGTFVYVATDTTSADDDSRLLVDADGNRFHRITSATLDVRWFGAKGDCTETDGGTDCTVPFQAAFDAAQDLNESGVVPGGVGIYMPAGVYRITGQLNVPSNVTLYGDSKDSSVVYMSGIAMSGSPGSYDFNGTAYYLFRVISTLGVGEIDERNIVFRNFAVWGDNGPTPLDPAAVYRQPQVGIQGLCFVAWVQTFGNFPQSRVWFQDCAIKSVYGFCWRDDGGGLDLHFDRNQVSYAGSINLNAENGTVNDNECDHIWGIECANQGIRVLRNKIHTTFRTGIAIGGAGGYQHYISEETDADEEGNFRNVVADNIIYDSGSTGVGSGIDVADGNVGTIVARNIINGTADGYHGIAFGQAFAIPPRFCLIKDNIIMQSGDIGIHDNTGGYANVFRGNKIHKNAFVGGPGGGTSTGLVIEAGTNYIVEENEAVGAGSDIVIKDCTNIRLKNNVGVVTLQGTNTFAEEGVLEGVFGTGTTVIGPYTDSVVVVVNGAVTVQLPSSAAVGRNRSVYVTNNATQVSTTTVTSTTGSVFGGNTLVGPDQSAIFRTVDGTNWYNIGKNDKPLTVNISRVARGTPWFSNASEWAINDDGHAVAQVNTDSFAYWVLDVPHGSLITTVTAFLSGTGHGALPASMPVLTVHEHTISTNGTSTAGTATDGSGSTGAYDAAHVIDAAVSITVDNVDHRYVAILRNEHGADAQVGLDVYMIMVSFTTTLPDRGAA